MSELPVFHARSFLFVNPREFVGQLPVQFMLEYDNGQVAKSTRSGLVYSWFIWEFHRRFPKLELVYEHHLRSLIGDSSEKMVTVTSHLDLIQRIHVKLIRSMGHSSHTDREQIQAISYDVTNNIHNELQQLAGKYVANIDIVHILEIETDPEICRLRDATKPTPSSIADFYSTAHQYIKTNPKFSNNSLVKYLKMGLLNLNQVNQCILMRGFPVEVTGVILSTLIRHDYATGMVDLYSYIAESRSAAKHLYSAEDPLRKSEYFARRLQLACMVVEGIVDRDCGSQKYFEHFVKAPVVSQDTGRIIEPGDLKTLRGAYYLDESTGCLKEIVGNERHLYNTVIKLRTVISCCEPNPHLVCSTCFGAMHLNVSRFANVGHMCCATFTHDSTQNILSTKHVIGSGVGTAIFLNEDGRRYFIFNDKTMSFHTKPGLNRKGIKLVVPQDQFMGVADLAMINDLKMIVPSRISSVVGIEMREPIASGAMFPTIVQIQQNNRNGYFTTQFIDYIKRTGWDSDERGNLIFDLSEWDGEHPVIRVPDMEYSYYDHFRQIERLIDSAQSNTKIFSKLSDPDEMLRALYTLVNSKLSVNIALLSVIVYANMTPSRDDYGMARNVPGAIYNTPKDVISNRSVSQALMFEKQHKKIPDPRSFILQNQPSTPIDVFITPREVVEDYASRRIP